ncbi:hypothetical protein HZA33_05320 [Candidatus Pacearchaeota archaeon]|nr:hypothetical protein [Candidatus Pacearchaeota archaeon]
MAEEKKEETNVKADLTLLKRMYYGKSGLILVIDEENGFIRDKKNTIISYHFFKEGEKKACCYGSAFLKLEKTITELEKSLQEIVDRG